MNPSPTLSSTVENDSTAIGGGPNTPIGDAPPSSSWPVWVWSAVWAFWLVFLVVMVAQR